MVVPLILVGVVSPDSIELSDGWLMRALAARAVCDQPFASLSFATRHPSVPGMGGLIFLPSKENTRRPYRRAY
jgi:hypothetical protein